MKSTVYGIFVILSLTPVLMMEAAFAQVRPSPSVRLTPAQVQHLSRDLVPSNAQDFFKQGQEQLEKEIETLTRKRQFLQEGILKISQDVEVQQDLSQFERPGILRPDR